MFAKLNILSILSIAEWVGWIGGIEFLRIGECKLLQIIGIAVADAFARTLQFREI